MRLIDEGSCNRTATKLSDVGRILSPGQAGMHVVMPPSVVIEGNPTYDPAGLGYEEMEEGMEEGMEVVYVFSRITMIRESGWLPLVRR